MQAIDLLPLFRDARVHPFLRDLQAELLEEHVVVEAFLVHFNATRIILRRRIACTLRFVKHLHQLFPRSTIVRQQSSTYRIKMPDCLTLAGRRDLNYWTPRMIGHRLLN